MLHLLVQKFPNAQIKIINDKNIKINVLQDDHFRQISEELNDNQCSWYSYGNKQDRPIKVMANKFHHSIKSEYIIQHMRKHGYKILEATPKLKYKTKTPLNMFMLSFKHDESVDKIYGITDILGVRVEILPLRKSRLIPQCKKCQAYGHTYKYCHKKSRCVRCTGRHLTIDCDKPKEAKPNCVHCGEEHPANYRGCTIAKEMQKIKDNRSKKTDLPRKPYRSNQQVPASNRRNEETKENKSYSQVVSGKSNNNQQQQIQKSDQNSSIQNTLQQILDKLSNMDERIKYFEYSAKGAIPKRHLQGK